MAGHSIMVNPAVVPGDHEHASGPTNSSKHPRFADPVSQFWLHGRSLVTIPSRGIPGNAIDLILSSWRSKTNSNYNSAWRKWEEWCRQKCMHPYSADVSSILVFLADQFEEGSSIDL